MQVVIPSQAEESSPSPRQPRQPKPRAPRADSAGAEANTANAAGNAGPVPASVAEVLALFERRSAELRFPNVDAESLRALVDRVELLRVEAAGALTQWEAARVASERSEVELLEMSKRAIAYARVFAADDPTLASELDAILRTEPERGKRRKRDSSPTLQDTTAAPAAEPVRVRRAPRREANDAKPAVEEPLAQTGE